MHSSKISELRGLSAELDFFSNSTLFDEELLRRGVYPPLPICGDMLVWGFHILDEAGRRGITNLYCEQVTGKAVDLLLLALKLENRINRYAWTEKEAFYRYIKRHSIEDRNSDIERIIADSGSFFAQIEIFLSLGAGLKNLVSAGKVDLKTAQRLKGMPDEICNRISQRNDMSFSDNRIFLTAVLETGLRDGVSDSELVQYAGRLLESKDPVRSAESGRFPVLTSMKENFELINKKYLKASGIRLTPPKYFEGDFFDISFSFRNAKQLEAKLRILAELKDGCDELFSLLQ